jgi:MFS family permease
VANPVAPVRLITRGFVALLASALAFFIAGGIVLPVATRYADGPIGADAAGVGVAIGAFAVAALVLRPVVGWASDRFGRRPLLLLGGTVTVAALALHLVATTLPLFIGVRALLGVGEAFYFVAALAAISDLAPPNRRGEAINVGSLSVYLGLALGPAIGESILAAAGFDAVWFAASLTAIAATALVLFVP